MKNLVEAWLESLQFFRLDNLKNIALLTLKSWIGIWLSLLRYLWWLFLLFSFLFFLVPSWLPISFMFVAWCLILTLAARPSLERKRNLYFLQNSVYGLPLLLGSYFCCTPETFLYILMPYFSLVALFFYDSTSEFLGIFLALFRAARMVLYKMPVMLVCMLLWFGVSFLFSYIVFIGILPLWMAFISRCYVVWLHRDYKEYFENV